MELKDFDYELPEELIAQQPVEPRDASRLMTVDRSSGVVGHRRFNDITEHLREGDLLVMNDTRVFQARLHGNRETGGRVELLVVERVGVEGPRSGEVWRCMLRPSKRAWTGTIYLLDPEGEYTAMVLGKDDDGLFRVEFKGPGPVEDLLRSRGEVPLPPYIKRQPSGDDAERYQTVYARTEGAVAAPTAGLHFTGPLLERLREKGVQRTTITLHVGPGTFLPVRTENIEEHRMLRERYTIPPDVFDEIRRAKEEGRRVVAVGTTTTRALEGCAQDGLDKPGLEGATDLFIYPGYEFRVVDAMVTNFHLPRSTLLMLVSAFAGRDLMMRAYLEAVARKYRFYSYGDAMFIF